MEAAAGEKEEPVGAIPAEFAGGGMINTGGVEEREGSSTEGGDYASGELTGGDGRPMGSSA